VLLCCSCSVEDYYQQHGITPTPQHGNTAAPQHLTLNSLLKKSFYQADQKCTDARRPKS
jgi:hypothetical protein